MPALLSLLPLALGAALAATGHLDPLALPLIGGAALGFALRRASPFDLALLAATTAALCTPTPTLRFAGWAALIALGLADARRIAFAPVVIGLGATGAAVLLDPQGPATVLTQIRLLGLSAGGLIAVGGLAWLGGPRGRRAAALAFALGVWALCRGAATAWPDAWRLASPYLAWIAVLMSALAVSALSRSWFAVGAVILPGAVALLGGLSGTALGIEGAAWALSGPMLVAGLADDSARLPGRWSILAMSGVPGGLPGIGVVGALWAASSAVHPAPLRPAAVLTVVFGLSTLALIIQNTPRAPADRRCEWLVTGGLLVMGLLLAFGPRPTAAAAEVVAEAMETRRLPVDDMRGWRRLSALEAPPPPEKSDAGVGE